MVVKSHMSRIGKKPIQIPKGVQVKINGQKITVKGLKGELSLKLRPEIKVEVQGNELFVVPQRKTKKTKPFWGLIRALLYNLVEGVSEGFEKKLQLEGVGYRAKLEGNDLVLEVGFSHPVKIICPEGIAFLVEKNIISVSGADKEKIGQIAATIRRVKPVEPYKGKGIRYLGEVVRRKEGKKAAGAVK